MLLGPDADMAEPRTKTQLSIGALFAALFVMILSGAISSGLREGDTRFPQKLVDGSTAAIGDALFTTFVFPFELASLLILAAIIGSVFLGYEKKRPLKAGRGLAAVQEKAAKERAA